MSLNTDTYSEQKKIRIQRMLNLHSSTWHTWWVSMLLHVEDFTVQMMVLVRRNLVLVESPFRKHLTSCLQFIKVWAAKLVVKVFRILRYHKGHFFQTASLHQWNKNAKATLFQSWTVVDYSTKMVGKKTLVTRISSSIFFSIWMVAKGFSWSSK